LVVWEAAGNGHNDIVMVCLAVAGVLALVRGRSGLAIVLLVASALVKFATILLLPFFLAYALRASPDRPEALRRAGVGPAAGAALAIVSSLPFWAGSPTLGFLSRRGWFTASFPTLIRQIFFERLGWTLDEAGRITSQLVAIPFGITYLVQLVAA